MHGFASFWKAGSESESASKWKLDPDLHHSEQQDSDPHRNEKVEALVGRFGALEGTNLKKVSEK
jgi:hypothetical protein